MNHATASIDRISELLKRNEIDPLCTGPGQCHAALCWCNTCGDVDEVCHDSYNCDQHRPRECCGKSERNCEILEVCR